MKEIRVEFVMRPPKLKTCLSRERPAAAPVAAGLVVERVLEIRLWGTRNQPKNGFKAS